MKDDNRPLMVSIRCLTYNHEPYIRQCLEGFVMQQANFRFEAIVHDDASTDRTAAIVKEYAEKYPDIIKPIFETENQYSKHDGSLSRIMNEACRGKYIAMCEGDDYWIDPLKLQKQVDFMENNPEFVICSHTYTRLVENTNTRFFDFNDYSFSYYNAYCIYRITLDNYLEKWALQPLSCLIRTECIPLNYSEKFKKIYDIIQFYYILKKGDGAMLYNNMGVYRVHLGGVWQGRNRLERYKIRYDEVVNLFQVEHNKFLLKDLSKTINGILLYYLKRGDVKNCCKNIHQFMIDLPVGFVFYCILNVFCHLFISFFRKIRYIF